MSPSGPALVVCPTIHVEQLSDDRVWQVVRRSLETLRRNGGRCTAFVATRRARQVGFDLSDRLSWLAGEGHEIAMHTHFRLPGAIDEQSRAESKHHTATREDVIASLEADYAYLAERGHTPIGFCAGRWAASPAVDEWLAARGFRYDCSSRSYAPGYRSATAAPTLDTPMTRTIAIPTTATLRAMVIGIPRFRFPSLPYDGGSFSLFYLHDYDLRARAKQAGFAMLARRLHSTSVIPVKDLLPALAPPADHSR